MAENQITPLALHHILEAHAALDPRIRSFRMGDEWGVEASAENLYALLTYELTGSRVSYRNGQLFTTYGLRLYLFNQRTSDWLNTSFSYSHASNILIDFLVRLMGDSELEDRGVWFGDQEIELGFVPIDGRDLLTVTWAEVKISAPVTSCATELP